MSAPLSPEKFISQFDKLWARVPPRQRKEARRLLSDHPLIRGALERQRWFAAMKLAKALQDRNRGPDNPERDDQIMELYRSGTKRGRIHLALKLDYPDLTREAVKGVIRRRTAGSN